MRFVGDGPRDEATVPPIVKRILNTQFEDSFRPWARLHEGGKGYSRKLLYALRQVRVDSADGMVATVDTDRAKKGARLKRLSEGRAADRKAKSPIPTALGEATPHGEAWLLADRVALKEALGLPDELTIPSVRDEKNPKKAIADLHVLSPRASEDSMPVLGDIARRVDPQRCKHAGKTGFRAFMGDVRTELEPLFTSNQH